MVIQMKIKVQCECGNQFDVEIDNTLYVSGREYNEVKMGKQHCTDPDCDKTVHINASVYSCVEPDEKINNPRIDWEEIKVGDTISYKGGSYEVVLKAARNLKNKELTGEKINLLYLRSELHKNNLVLEVRKSGFLSLPSLGSLNHATLTNEEIEFMKKE